MEAGRQWEKIGFRHHHGINTPLFSIRSKNSCGIGEFNDLKLLIDWLQPMGFDVIQLLPMNDSGQDPSPYNSLSANALHPIYISLHSLPGIEKHADLISKMEALRQHNSAPHVPYHIIRKGKDEILKIYVEREKIQNQPAFQEFLKNNPWVEDYARFKALKNQFQDRYWRDWPDGAKPNDADVLMHKVIQFLCFSQMQDVKKYAESKGMFLKGDIPILLSPDSADVWSHPEIFDLTQTAGAPPDMYNQEGQSWGFPIYKYDALEKENYAFWKDRLNTASSLYHIYRLDHIVGFFRIWAIPEGKKGLDGHYESPDESKWVPQGTKMLHLMLENSPMLPIGEDLGNIPPATRVTMHELGIPGTKVIRWERAWHQDRSYIPYDQYPEDSMTCVSTHDSEPLDIWWKSSPEEVQAFCTFKKWEMTPELTKEHHFEILHDSHHTKSIFHINLLQEYLALYPELTWGNPAAERINLPGIISPLNWTFRYKPTLEEMAQNTALSQTLRDIIK